MLNAGAICIICPLSYGILRLIRASISPSQSQQKKTELQHPEKEPEVEDPTIVLDAHSALNIALFPPLFFFSALYYTDVVSTLVVLLTYSVYLKKSTVAGNVFENINAVSIGVIALLFRQTNIFWVAVFPAGLAVIEALRKDRPRKVDPRAEDMTKVLQSSWSEGNIYDCSMQDAEPRGWLNPSHR